MSLCTSLFVCAAVLVVIVLFLDSHMFKTVEAFDYDKCRQKGFSKEFCVTTPVAVVGPGGCRCPDGRIGQYIPGFGPNCVCYDSF